MRMMMNKYPKIDSVKAQSKKHLLVTFRNGVRKLYDCKPLLVLEPFEALGNEVLFKMVKADRGGYGVSWNDEIDLSESELWLRGKIVEEVGLVTQNQQLGKNEKLNSEELVFAF